MSDQLTMEALARLVPVGSRVLDLGCGDGAMLDHLQRTRGCTGYGIEIDDANVLACVQRGVNVIQLNLDEGLALFGDQSFDVVLQIDTLQHLRNAETMLRETARVGRIGIVAFPNFAHWPNRLSVLRGRMPVTRRLPYQWYDTPGLGHIRRWCIFMAVVLWPWDWIRTTVSAATCALGRAAWWCRSITDWHPSTVSRPPRKTPWMPHGGWRTRHRHWAPIPGAWWWVVTALAAAWPPPRQCTCVMPVAPHWLGSCCCTRLPIIRLARPMPTPVLALALA